MKQHAKTEKDKRVKFTIQNATDLYDSNFVAQHMSQKQVGPSTKSEVKAKIVAETNETARELDRNERNNYNNHSHNNRSGGNYNRFSRGSNNGPTSGGFTSKSSDAWNKKLGESTSTSRESKERSMKTVRIDASDDNISLRPSGGGFSRCGRGSTGGNNPSSRTNNNNAQEPRSIPSRTNKFDPQVDLEDMDSFNFRPNNRGWSDKNLNNNDDSARRKISAPSKINPQPISTPTPQPPHPSIEEDPDTWTDKFNSCYGEYLNVRDLNAAKEDVAVSTSWLFYCMHSVNIKLLIPLLYSPLFIWVGFLTHLGY